MFEALRRLLPSKSDREVKRLWLKVDEINQVWETYKDLADADLPKKTEEFIARIKDGEPLDDLTVEAFALVKEGCRRLVGKKWSVTENEITWDMVPFDVQLIGGLVLHEGKATEMKTGEGKTLVAVMPLYLNALEGKGAHLVTVNDYLAKRDREWMGPVFESLGLTVGYIQQGMDPDERRPQYNAHITYGTNNEFGFDYLRDNMVVDIRDKVQRGFNYAIVDEVDIILVDEARTPLIISGPVAGSRLDFKDLTGLVSRSFREQDRLVSRIVDDGERLYKSGKLEDAGVKFLQALRGSPKNKKLMRMEQEEGVKRAIEKQELEFIREKRFHEIDDDLFFVIDEKNHNIDLTEKGRQALSPNDPTLFVLPDLSSELAKAEVNPDLAPQDRLALKEKIYHDYALKSEKLHNFQALLKAYALFEKDVDYVVTPDGNVVIVDEFTGRLMPGRRFSDGLHEALEAKENVIVREETQTLGTITLQNYFRMYKKLGGMSGTALTVASELFSVYKLDAVEIPTNAPVRRKDYHDIVYRTKQEKYRAVVEEIAKWHKRGRPILVGTTSVQVSEELDRMLRPKGINYSVLNAKNHAAESQIIKDAGMPYAVTIATNMAGRGTDIKLGKDVVKGEQCWLTDGEGKCPYWDEQGGKCEEEVPCGLYIIGTERHEARRIDDQLRGRSGRQGDPGSSRFFLSLEDDLMRLFGSDRVAAIMDRFGQKEMEPIETPMISRAIAGAQKRVEVRNAEMRKHLLEYDDVMNKQREVVYTLRDRILVLDAQPLTPEPEPLTSEPSDSEPPSPSDAESLKLSNAETLFKDIAYHALATMVEKHCSGNHPEEWNWQDLRAEFGMAFLADFEIPADDVHRLSIESLADLLLEIAVKRFHQRQQQLGDQLFANLLKVALLRTLDSRWRDHLYALDAVREGINLRAYGQKDPLLEYKQESFKLFDEMMTEYRREAVTFLFRAEIRGAGPGGQGAGTKGQGLRTQDAPSRAQPVRAFKPEAGSGPPAAGNQQPATGNQKPQRRTETKVGRNDPCPCGSGKKYKKCCGKE
jgi:preprotein translocase subunit SecA